VNVHLTDTYFVIAHFHYVMVGGTLMGFMAGLHYWFPKFFGKMYNEASARWGFLLVVLGFNVTFFPQFILGAQGMPRRYWDYLPEFTLLNRISTVGSWMIGLGFLWSAVYLGRAMMKGVRAPGNPWQALTLEWQTPSPPPHDNFPVTPIVNNWPYEYRPEGGVVPLQSKA
jgi:cytochrome c oxidase subunit 1